MGDDDIATQEQQRHAGWRNTYIEHVLCNRSGRSPLSDLSESGDTFGVSGNVWVTDTLLEKRRGIGRIGDTVWSLV